MSCLKLYWPQALSLYRAGNDDGDEVAADDEPVILRFPRIASRLENTASLTSLERARVLYGNRLGPDCGRAAVLPIGSHAALLSRDRMPIPGTGALVGFCCEACGHEWDA